MLEKIFLSVLLILGAIFGAARYLITSVRVFNEWAWRWSDQN